MLLMQYQWYRDLIKAKKSDPKNKSVTVKPVLSFAGVTVK